MAEHALVSCPGCGSEVWPFEEMDARGGLVSRCPAEGCGHQFPRAVAAEEAYRGATVVPLRATIEALAPATSPASPVELGTPELRYLRDALTQCEVDVDALKKRIQRALALIQ